MNCRPSPRRDPIRILIADSTRMGSELLAEALGRDRHLSIVGCAADWDEVTEILPRRPQVAILGIDFEQTLGGLNVAQKLGEHDPSVRVVILLHDGSDRDLVVQAFRAGARGMSSRAESVSAAARCIQAVAQGQIWATSEQCGYLLDSLRSFAPPRSVRAEGLSLLSEREQEVVRYVAEGLNNREIARKMNLSDHTIKNHLFRIYNRLGISSRIEIIFALMNQSPAGAGKDGCRGPDRRGGPKSEVELFELYLHHADKAPYAQYMVARMYIEGRGVPKDEVTGYTWLLLAEQSAAKVIAQSKTLRKELAARVDTARLQQARQNAVKRWEAYHPAEEFRSGSQSSSLSSQSDEDVFAACHAKAV